MAAGTTYLGRFLPTSFARTEEYRAVATAPPRLRMDPKTPVARPMSCGSQTSVTPGKEMFSMNPAAAQCQYEGGKEYTVMCGGLKLTDDE